MTARTAEHPDSLESRIVRAALDVGFVRAGIAVFERSEQAAERLRRWLDAGYHGEMQYMAGALDRTLPTNLFEAARSVLVVALPYGDQGLLVPRRLYKKLGGYRDLARLEDADIVRRIGRRRLVLLRSRAVNSARARQGWLKPMALSLLHLLRVPSSMMAKL